jgi:hypothetical protein
LVEFRKDGFTAFHNKEEYDKYKASIEKECDKESNINFRGSPPESYPCSARLKCYVVNGTATYYYEFTYLHEAMQFFNNLEIE